MTTFKEASGIIGTRIDSVTRKPIEVDELEHFYKCKACGQSVDMRDLGHVSYHEEEGHIPLEPDC